MELFRHIAQRDKVHFMLKVLPMVTSSIHVEAIVHGLVAVTKSRHSFATR